MENTLNAIEQCFKIRPFKSIQELSAETGKSEYELLNALRELKSKGKLTFYTLKDGTRKYCNVLPVKRKEKGEYTNFSIEKETATRVAELKVRFNCKTNDELISYLTQLAGIQE